MDKKKKIMVYNGLFIIFCVGLFLFLWSAPPETTARLPNNENHERFISGRPLKNLLSFEHGH